MKFFLSSLLLLVSLSAFSQRTVTLTEDLILTEPLVISEDTWYEGNGFQIICEGCKSAVMVKGTAQVHFQDTYFIRNSLGWISVVGSGQVTWDSPRMRGYIIRLN